MVAITVYDSTTPNLMEASDAGQTALTRVGRITDSARGTVLSRSRIALIRLNKSVPAHAAMQHAFACGEHNNNGV
ncbi:hypothetical protein [Xanthomonas cannabis]|uniref:Uncharacterized protein n=1 Tax=Xanthomonas cannabis TaxID=1885674 RepID=A0ABR6JG41_9XANT|nr:hypothetical protein [Xanthomonas cannabis]MBB4591713.1 hypothetical protein [Xanthomonas cannabis]MBB5521074.1 hypothetical protein [Xanthomonas cannabis]